MRVLFLAPEPPDPPNSGARIRNLNILKMLNVQHEASLVTFSSQSETSPILRQLCVEVRYVPAPTRTRWDRIRDIRLAEPDLARRLISPAFTEAVREVTDRLDPDLIHVGGLEMAFAGYPLRDRHAIVLDEHNAEYVLQRRAFENECRPGGNPIGAAFSLIQWAKLRRFEANACRRADATMAVSAIDAAAILAAAGDVPLTVVSNTIDVADYPEPDYSRERDCTIAFTGKMDFRPNVDAVVWFVSAVWPLILQSEPGARFLIVGRNPTPRVTMLGREPGVVVTGEIEDDRPYVERAAAFIVPMRVGGGARLKILQAMAAGVPVISTSLGHEGIDAVPGEHLTVVDEPSAMARAVIDHLRDRTSWIARAQAARILVEQHYDWRSKVEMLDNCYAAALSASRPRTGRLLA